MNAPNIKRSIVSNARKPVTNALKNAGTWQRNNTYPPVDTYDCESSRKAQNAEKLSVHRLYVWATRSSSCPPPAYEYAGTTTIDLTTLRFSRGIGTTFTPQMKANRSVRHRPLPLRTERGIPAGADGAGWPLGG